MGNLLVEMGLAELKKCACDQNGGPPDLPLAVMVKLDKYRGPTFMMAPYKLYLSVILDQAP